MVGFSAEEFRGSAVLDVTQQRRVEDPSRQQRERLQASARPATMGEMQAAAPGMLREALQRIGEQAERAGRVIRSVQDFVRRRGRQREVVGCAQLLDAVPPLVRLQVCNSRAHIEVELPDPVLQVRCDRTMGEQALLNLARNGIQAMEADMLLPLRVFRYPVPVYPSSCVKCEPCPDDVPPPLPRPAGRLRRGRRGGRA